MHTPGIPGTVSSIIAYLTGTFGLSATGLLIVHWEVVIAYIFFACGFMSNILAYVRKNKVFASPISYVPYLVPGMLFFSAHITAAGTQYKKNR